MIVRLRFTKQGKVKWTSHRDLARMWERAFRRAQLPIAYTGGFSPRPKVSFGLALPTGAESEAEYLDAFFDGDVDVAALPARLSPVLPVGVDVIAAAEIDAPESLQQAVTATTWRVVLDGADFDQVERSVAGALVAPALVVSRTRKGQAVTDDIRPAIVALTVSHDGDHTVLECELATQPRGLRPAELLAALDLDPADARVTRLRQWITRDGRSREEPLPLDPPDARRALERAS